MYFLHFLPKLFLLNSIALYLFLIIIVLLVSEIMFPIFSFPCFIFFNLFFFVKLWKREIFINQIDTNGHITAN